jgi:hypothetical protein
MLLQCQNQGRCTGGPIHVPQHSSEKVQTLNIRAIVQLSKSNEWEVSFSLSSYIAQKIRLMPYAENASLGAHCALNNVGQKLPKG